MAWVRTIVWSSKLPFADCLKHFKSATAPVLKDSPATAMQYAQTGPNSGLFIAQFDNKRDLNKHEKLLVDARKSAGRQMKIRMTVHDGAVKWSG